MKRLIHDVLHIALIPFSALIVLGSLNPKAEAIVEQADFLVHLVFLALSIHALMDWAKARKEAH